MNAQWAIRMSAADAGQLGKLRQRPGVEICPEREHVWLRFGSPPAEADVALRALPGTYFHVLVDGQLIEFGKRVPHGRLPEKNWLKLAAWINVDTEPASDGGRAQQQVPLRLVRGASVAEANLLATTWGAWSSYALQAPQVRLERWSFALGEEGRVIVRGAPLPPLAGARYVEQAGIAVAAGWQFAPAVSAAIVRAVLGLANEDLALFHADQTWDMIPADAFVRATRSAVRLTGAEAAHG